MEIMFGLFFVMFFGVFIYNIVMNVSRWIKNNNSPRLSVDATVVTKRAHTSHHHHNHGNGHMHTSSSTSYYVTFQVESGDRMELAVKSYDYGMLVEGDFGTLSFQGTRFLGFERE